MVFQEANSRKEKGDGTMICIPRKSLIVIAPKIPRASKTEILVLADGPKNRSGPDFRSKHPRKGHKP